MHKFVMSGARPLCVSLDRPRLLYSALIGQWRNFSLTAKVAVTMELAKRIYELAQQQNDPALMVGAYRALAISHYYSGNFDGARQHARRGVEIWRSGMQSTIEEVHEPVVICLSFQALSEWHLGELAASQTASADAISLAKELNDMPALTHALYLAAMLAQYDDNRAEVERLASELIELSTRQNLAHFLPFGGTLRGWALAVSGSTAEGIAWIESGIRQYQATGSMVLVPYWLAIKAKALHLAGRTSEALQGIKDAESLSEGSGELWWRAELHRLRSVFLMAMGAEDTQIEASFCEAIRIAKEQKSVSLEKRAEATYAEYRRQRASGSGGHGFRLPLW
jgi:predicted ATPase